MDPIQTLQELISFPSVSSTSNAAVSDQAYRHLKSLGFGIERLSYMDAAGVEKVNLVAHRDPLDTPEKTASEKTVGGLAYFCHTDVVPVTEWTGPGGNAFAGIVAGDRVYGRGSCDMKGSLACILAAASRIDIREQTSPLWIVCTADEEVGFEGAAHIVAKSAEYRRIVAASPVAVIGEPTGLRVVNAHKGIAGFSVTSVGRAAHSSTDDGINANDAIVPVLQLLCETNRQTRTDASLMDDRFDPPHLSWTYGISDGATAINVTPGRSVAWGSLRLMPEIDGESLIRRVERVAESSGLSFRRFRGGKPVWVDPQSPHIIELCRIAGSENEPIRPMTVCYGTDAGEFHELQRRVILGPGHIAQAHTIDEWISLEQLSRGTDLYEAAIRRWCCDDGC